MPAPKRHRGLGMRYSTSLPSYLPLDDGRYESITRPLNQRCQTYANSESIPPTKLHANPVAPLPSPPSQAPHENIPLLANYKLPGAWKKQRRIGHPVTSWPARPGAANYFDTTQFASTQTSHSPHHRTVASRMSKSLKIATSRLCNSEVAVTSIAPVLAAVGAPGLSPSTYQPATPIMSNIASGQSGSYHIIIDITLSHRCPHQHLFDIPNIKMPILYARRKNRCCLFQHQTSQLYNQSVEKSAY